jgi:hypothetical protein
MFLEKYLLPENMVEARSLYPKLPLGYLRLYPEPCINHTDPQYLALSFTLKRLPALSWYQLFRSPGYKHKVSKHFRPPPISLLHALFTSSPISR